MYRKQKTIVLLKLPIDHRSFIKAREIVKRSILAEGFDSVGTEIALDEHQIGLLYSHVPYPILIGQLAQFAHKKVMVWMVTGEKSIMRMARAKGDNNDPMLCDPGSMRYQLAELLGPRPVILPLTDAPGRLGREIVAYDNYVHCPRPGEGAHDLRIFRSYFGVV